MEHKKSKVTPLKETGPMTITESYSFDSGTTDTKTKANPMIKVQQHGQMELTSQNTHVTTPKAAIRTPNKNQIFMKSFDSHNTLRNYASKEIVEGVNGVRSSINSGQVPANINEIGDQIVPPGTAAEAMRSQKNIKINQLTRPSITQSKHRTANLFINQSKTQVVHEKPLENVSQISMVRDDQTEEQAPSARNSGVLPLIDNNSQSLQVSGKQNNSKDNFSETQSFKTAGLYKNPQLNITVQSFESEMKKTKVSTFKQTKTKKWMAKPETPQVYTPETYSQHQQMMQSKQKNFKGKRTDRHSQDWLDIQNYEQFREKKLKDRKDAVKRYTLAITKSLPRPYYKSTKPRCKQISTLDVMEQDLQNQIRQIKQEATMVEDSFTDSLKRVNGKTFINSILPSLRRYQQMYCPNAGSQSRSPMLLRNTFSAEIYNQFIVKKKELRHDLKKQGQDREEKIKEYLQKSENLQTQASEIFRKKLREISEIQEQGVQKTQLIKLLSEYQPNAKDDMSYFKTLEFSFDKATEMQIDQAKRMFMTKVNQAKREEHHKVQELLKRKEKLEGKLEALKYHKLLKQISGTCKSSMHQHEFTKKPTSIYEENPADPKMGIPSNVYFYDNLIKEQFTVSDSSDSEEDLTENKYKRSSHNYAQALDRFKSRNKDKTAAPKQISDRRMKTLDPEDQVRLMKKIQQIRVMQRSDGQMVDDIGRGNILDILLKQGVQGDVNYQKEFKKLSKDLKLVNQFMNQQRQSQNEHGNFATQTDHQESIFTQISGSKRNLTVELDRKNRSKTKKKSPSPNLKSNSVDKSLSPVRSLVIGEGKFQTAQVQPLTAKNASEQVGSVEPLSPLRSKKTKTHQLSQSEVFKNSLTIGMDKQLEEKIQRQLQEFDDALSKGEFSLNKQQSFLQASSQLEDDSLFDKHSVVNEFIDLIQGQDIKHQMRMDFIHQQSDYQPTVEEEAEDDISIGKGSKFAFQTSSQILKTNAEQMNRSTSPSRQNSKVTPFMSQQPSLKVITSRNNEPLTSSHQGSQTLPILKDNSKMLMTQQSSVNQIKSPIEEQNKRQLKPVLQQAQRQIRLKNQFQNKIGQPGKSITKDVWSKVGENKTLQFAVLDQIVNSCDDLKRQNKGLKPELQPLNAEIEYMVDLHANRPKYDFQKPKRPTDTLRPQLWQNKGGVQRRLQGYLEKNEVKQDLLIMIESLAKNKKIDAYDKMTRS